jgi:hypothetical protein
MCQPTRSPSQRVHRTYISCDPSVVQRLDSTDTTGRIFLQQSRNQLSCSIAEFQERWNGVFSFTGKVGDRALVL